MPVCAHACVPLEQFAVAAVVDRMWRTCHCWFIVACKLHLKHAIDMQLLWFAVCAPGSFKLKLTRKMSSCYWKACPLTCMFAQLDAAWVKHQSLTVDAVSGDGTSVDYICFLPSLLDCISFFERWNTVVHKLTESFL